MTEQKLIEDSKFLMMNLGLPYWRIETDEYIDTDPHSGGYRTEFQIPSREMKICVSSEDVVVDRVKTSHSTQDLPIPFEYKAIEKPPETSTNKLRGDAFLPDIELTFDSILDIKARDLEPSEEYSDVEDLIDLDKGTNIWRGRNIFRDI